MDYAVWSMQVLKGEEVVIEKNAWGHFWFMVVMEKLKCMESSSYRKKCLRPFVHGCHGNAEIHMCTKFHLHALYGVQVWEVKK